MHPLADLKSGLSLSIETVGQMKEVGKGILEELVNAGKERTAAAVSAVGVDLDKEAISRRGAKPPRRGGDVPSCRVVELSSHERVRCLSAAAPTPQMPVR